MLDPLKYVKLTASQRRRLTNQTSYDTFVVVNSWERSTVVLGHPLRELPSLLFEEKKLLVGLCYKLFLDYSSDVIYKKENVSVSSASLGDLNFRTSYVPDTRGIC